MSKYRCAGRFILKTWRLRSLCCLCVTWHSGMQFPPSLNQLLEAALSVLALHRWCIWNTIWQACFVTLTFVSSAFTFSFFHVFLFFSLFSPLFLLKYYPVHLKTCLLNFWVFFSTLHPWQGLPVFWNRECCLSAPKGWAGSGLGYSNSAYIATQARGVQVFLLYFLVLFLFCFIDFVHSILKTCTFFKSVLLSQDLCCLSVYLIMHLLLPITIPAVLALLWIIGQIY